MPSLLRKGLIRKLAAGIYGDRCETVAMFSLASGDWKEDVFTAWLREHIKKR